MPGWIGLPELVAVVRGPTRLPKIGRNLGRTMREFKDAVRGCDGGAESASSDHGQPVD